MTTAGTPLNSHQQTSVHAQWMHGYTDEIWPHFRLRPGSTRRLGETLLASSGPTRDRGQVAGQG